MSNLSTIYTALNSLIASTLSTRTELPDPENLELNNNLYLTKGWGLSIGASSDTDREFCDKLYIEQEWTIHLTELLTATEHNTTAIKASKVRLLDDYILMAKAIASDPQLSNSFLTLHIGHGGLSFLEGDREKYLLLSISVSSEFSELLT